MNARHRLALWALSALAAVLAAGRWATAPASGAPADPPDSRDKLNIEAAGNEEVARIMRTFQGRGAVGDESKPTSAAAAMRLFKIAADLELDLIASEPTVAQPLHLSFDERGRLWVVQYRQYPYPAGLKITKLDEHLRAKFDRIPEPPPRHVPGQDRVTVLEDTNGDGTYDKVKDVITGLNIATAVAVGRGGIFVLNPPYLLYYPDRDRDDVPDGPPEVRLRGFGLEDTHAVANSLRFGPDGWLYGATGSTTTADISSAVTKNVRFLGQSIWRYHPETHVFEVFAEGGGNTFSLEIDSEGRLFSGTNNGDTRGMHHVQGGYARKNWGKHGPLTNPNAYGFFEHMPCKGERGRLSQGFVIHEAVTGWPERLRGLLVTANPLQGRVVASRLVRQGSTFRTDDVEPLVRTSDTWFRPVNATLGPDGAVYIADWYDTRLTHVDPRDNWHKQSGRIYRLRAKATGGSRSPAARIDLGAMNGADLVERLADPNRWVREQALRLIGDRRDKSLAPGLERRLGEATGARALGALWALHQLGALDERTTLRALAHGDAAVRRWAVRLAGDGRTASPPLARALIELAAREPDVEVRSQLASTARRLPASAALPIARALIARAGVTRDAEDPHVPLLVWWALEAKAITDRAAVLALFKDATLWRSPIAEQHLVARLMRRYAAAGTPADLQACATLLGRAPGPETTRALLAGFEEAFRGRPLPALPPALDRALGRHLAKSSEPIARALALRRGRGPEAAAAAARIADDSAPPAERLTLIEIAGQVQRPTVVPPLLAALESSRPEIRRGTLAALGGYADDHVAAAVLRLVGSPKENAEVRAAAFTLLLSRKPWTLRLLATIGAGDIDGRSLPPEVLRALRAHSDAEVRASRDKVLGAVLAPAPEKRDVFDRVAKALRAGHGDARSGKTTFTNLCAPCHSLFREGGHIGPDLTDYERNNLDSLLLAIVEPSAAMRDEYVSFTATTKDGRSLSGFLEEPDDNAVVLRMLDGQRMTIARRDLDKLEPSPVSLMPEGLLDTLEPRQVRDLFAYLTSAPPAR